MSHRRDITGPGYLGAILGVALLAAVAAGLAQLGVSAVFADIYLALDAAARRPGSR